MTVSLSSTMTEPDSSQEDLAAGLNLDHLNRPDTVALFARCRELGRSDRQARHIQNIYNKIGTSNRAGATRWALEHGVVAQGQGRASA